MITDGLVRGQDAVLYTFRPDASGWVHTAFPYDDPYVKSHPDQRRFNVEIGVVVPVGAAARTVTATAFVFDRVAGREVSITPVDGSTLAVPIAPTAPRSTAGMTEPTDCDQEWNVREYMCAETSYPSNMIQVPIVLAHNAAAGYDTNLTLTYDQAGRIQTTTAADFGAGIVEVGNSQSVSNSDHTTVTFGGGGVRYGPPEQWASVLTQWSQTDRFYCTKPSWPFSGPTHCERDATSWAPVAVTGSTQTVPPDADNPRHHDSLCVFGSCSIPDNVCVEQYHDGYTRGHGTQMAREYPAKVNVGGTLFGIDLHASAEYTRSNNSETTVTYAYRAMQPLAMRHALFSHAATAYDPAKVGGGICPSVNIGETWTATDFDFAPPKPQELDEEVESFSQNSEIPASQPYRKVGRCAYVPDDCRPDA